MPPRPRISVSQVPTYASRYDVPYDDPVARIVADVRSQGCLTKAQLVAVCRWKTPRSGPKVARNEDEAVRAFTKAALRESDPRVKVHVLMALDGLAMPSASVILHWFDREPYPILDVRALWSLGYDVPPAYTLDFWSDYVAAFRRQLRETGSDPRTLDRALWQYSKEHQR